MHFFIRAHDCERLRAKYAAARVAPAMQQQPKTAPPLWELRRGYGLGDSIRLQLFGVTKYF